VSYSLTDLDCAINWYHLHYEADEFETAYGLVEIVEENERGEDNEGEMYKVVRLNGETFKKTGYYQSYEGVVWDGPLTRVERKLVTREEWVEV
jgi:hypothetical protein